MSSSCFSSSYTCSDTYSDVCPNVFAVHPSSLSIMFEVVSIIFAIHSSSPSSFLSVMFSAHHLPRLAVIFTKHSCSPSIHLHCCLPCPSSSPSSSPFVIFAIRLSSPSSLPSSSPSVHANQWIKCGPSLQDWSTNYPCTGLQVYILPMPCSLLVFQFQLNGCGVM